jgi:hypothetical protein
VLLFILFHLKVGQHLLWELVISREVILMNKVQVLYLIILCEL